MSYPQVTLGLALSFGFADDVSRGDWLFYQLRVLRWTPSYNDKVFMAAVRDKEGLTALIDKKLGGSLASF